MTIPDATATLRTLTSAGALSIITAGIDLVVTGATGKAAAGIETGRPLLAQLPVLVGLEEELEGLIGFTGRRIELPNISVASREGAARQDIVVVFDDASRSYFVMIAPAIANDALAIELEQALRHRYLLESQVAGQTRAVMAANAALGRANADLVDFTRIVSHDLKAPMRAMRYTTDDLEQAIAAGDRGEQATALDELRFMTARLSRMVQDLLAYARLDDKTEAETDVDTRALLADIIAALPRPPGLHVVVRGHWPVVKTLAPLLDLVLRNLLDNAIKHHDTAVGTIEVAAEPSPAALAITVIDDGPGIPERHRGAVLAPLAKLPSCDPGRDAGSGLGLAMVDKVLRRTGGRIEISARLDGRRGTRVQVTWPLTMVLS